MTKTKKALKWTAIVLAFLLLGVPLLLAAINAFDEDLRPEAIAFADFSDEEVPPEQNGYYAWVGLRVPVGESPHARGMQIVAQVNEKLDVMPRDIIDSNTLLGAKALKFTNKLGRLCGRDATDCLDRYRAKSSDIEKQVRENKLLLERYRVLYRYPHFHETIKPRFFAPLFYEPASVSGLAHAQAALYALRGDHLLAVRQLRDDTLFWRRILIDSRGLVGKMIAVAMIRINSQITSEIVARYPTDKRSLTLAAQAVQPLTDQERDLTNAYRNEFALGMHFFTTLPSEQRTPCTTESIYDCALEKLSTTFLFKPHATVNQSFENFRKIATRSNLSAAEFLNERRDGQASGQYDWDWLTAWRFAYNPVGKILNAIAVSAYGNYTARVHNLDGFLRLVSLSLAAKGQAIHDTDMPGFIARAKPNLRNPYTNEPMMWDAGNRAIYFDGMDDDKPLGKRIEVRL
jgi:hypothetical protein